jgi:dCTP diphosphatase
MNTDSIGDLTEMIRNFAVERNWRRFHNPRNLATALAVEAAELLEPFQWDLDADQALSDTRRADIAQELADVTMYLFHLADVTEVDLGQAVLDKLAINGDRWPASATTDGDWQPRDRTKLTL